MVKQKTLFDFEQLDSRVEPYFEKCSKAIMDAARVHDLAVSSEKMMDWACIGDDNSAWREGPYLSSPRNEKQIDRSFPYVMRNSIFTIKVAEIILSGKVDTSQGKVKIPSRIENSSESVSEQTIAKMSIIEQFELFKDFLLDFDGPYNKKRAQNWQQKLDNWIYTDLVNAIERRNELVHNTYNTSAAMKEAIEYFFTLVSIAPHISLARCLPN